MGFVPLLSEMRARAVAAKVLRWAVSKEEGARAGTRPQHACTNILLRLALASRFELHRLQRDLLRQQDVADGQIPPWAEAPLGDYIATGIEFFNVHRPTRRFGAPASVDVRSSRS
jgi:hypothetical protein